MDDCGQVLEVDLVDDAAPGRHDPKILERFLGPAQQSVALLISLELEIGVALERLRRAERVDLNRVVDHQLAGHQRVDLRRIAIHLAYRVAHRGEVDHRRDAREVLHHHPGGRERNLLSGLRVGVPFRQRLHVFGVHSLAVFVAQQVLEQHLERER